ncbi:hypothetical protein [Arthrobacter sp. A2-55]|uniref:hypothetical protein n=1 Tax=Arthrobacter sp. A2-55 TaxID=2897337 RepID=UPI0021CD55A3|nr:hypothetical protein [Arthrobacter sp. A2-55]MCU6481327.1 hypothetical protein [Arthrobacter sp. A2-55]
MDTKPTERSMLNLLLNRYTDFRRGTLTDRWVRAEHVKSGMGYIDGQRTADFVAADKRPGIPYGTTLALIGHEVKVSRSDWLTELKDMDKSHAIKRYMHHWYLVVPDAAIVKPGELPADWGLLVSSGEGLRAKVKAPRLAPEPAPLDFTISLMNAAAKTAHRESLHRDAPSIWLDRKGQCCGFCGGTTPCSFHQQPRKAAVTRRSG